MTDWTSWAGSECSSSDAGCFLERQPVQRIRILHRVRRKYSSLFRGFVQVNVVSSKQVRLLFNVNCCCCCWCCCCCCCCCCSQEFSGGDVQYRNRRRGRSPQCHGVGKAKNFLRPCSRTNLHNCWRFLRLHPATSVLHTVSQLPQLPPSLLPALHPLWKLLCPVLCQLFSPSPIHTIALKVSTIFIKRGTKKHEKVTIDETPLRRCCRPPPRRFNFPFRRDVRRNELNGGRFSTQSFVCLGFSIRGKWVCDNFCNYSLSNDLRSWRLKLLPTSTDKLHLIVGFT